MPRILRERKRISYDVGALQKEERRQSRINAMEYRREKAKAATRKRRAERKRRKAEAKALPKLVVDKLTTLKEICNLSRGEFTYWNVLNLTLHYYGYKKFNPFEFSVECNEMLVNDLQKYINNEIDYLTNLYNEGIDAMIENKRVDACNIEKLKSFKF